MRDTMGMLRIATGIASTQREDVIREFPDTLVATGAELSCVPRAVLEEIGITPRKRVRFQMANGEAILRDIGYAIVHAVGAETPDEVTFGEEGDLVLLGARSL